MNEPSTTVTAPIAIGAARNASDPGSLAALAALHGYPFADVVAETVNVFEDPDGLMHLLPLCDVIDRQWSHDGLVTHSVTLAVLDDLTTRCSYCCRAGDIAYHTLVAGTGASAYTLERMFLHARDVTVILRKAAHFGAPSSGQERDWWDWCRELLVAELFGAGEPWSKARQVRAEILERLEALVHESGELDEWGRRLGLWHAAREGAVGATRTVATVVDTVALTIPVPQWWDGDAAALGRLFARFCRTRPHGFAQEHPDLVDLGRWWGEQPECALSGEAVLAVLVRGPMATASAMDDMFGPGPIVLAVDRHSADALLDEGDRHGWDLAVSDVTGLPVVAMTVATAAVLVEDGMDPQSALVSALAATA